MGFEVTSNLASHLIPHTSFIIHHLAFNILRI